MNGEIAIKFTRLKNGLVEDMALMADMDLKIGTYINFWSDVKDLAP